MTIILIILSSILALYFYLVDCWFSYIAVMKLKEMRDNGTLGKLGRFAKMSAYAGLGLALVKDASLVLLFALILLNVPREFTLTAMLKRLQITDAGKWRGVRAEWLCVKLLNQFDQSRKHC